MILTGLAAAVLAVLQFFLDAVMFRSVFSGKPLRAVALLLLKLALYAGGFALLFLCFRQYVTGAAVGFGVGFFPAVLIYGLVYAKRNLSVGSRKSAVESPANAKTEEEE